MRLIDADEVEKYLEPYDIDSYELQGVLYAISKMPTIEPERKKGKWIDENGNEVPFFKGTTEPSKSCWCSNCKEWLTASDEYPVEGAFCPNCGADMRGEQE